MPSLPRTTATLISLHFKQTELRNLVSGLLMERLVTLRFAAYEERRGRRDNSLRKGLAILLRFFDMFQQSILFMLIFYLQKNSA